MKPTCIQVKNIQTSSVILMYQPLYHVLDILIILQLKAFPSAKVLGQTLLKILHLPCSRSTPSCISMRFGMEYVDRKDVQPKISKLNYRAPEHKMQKGPQYI